MRDGWRMPAVVLSEKRTGVIQTLLPAMCPLVDELRVHVGVILARGVLAVAAALSGTALAGGEGQVCGPQTLNGTYVFDAHGFNIVNGVSVPKAILQGLDFNGDGTAVVPFVTVSINGIILRASGTTATYTVAENCTGTVATAEICFCLAPGITTSLVSEVYESRKSPVKRSRAAPSCCSTVSGL